MPNYGYHETLWLKWRQRSADKKRGDALRESVKKILAGRQMELRLTSKPRRG